MQGINPSPPSQREGGRGGGRAPASRTPVRALLLATLTFTACATDPLPTFPGLDASSAVSVAASRHAAPPLRATGSVTLTRVDGDTVTLDAALVARGTDHARLRAWKFGQAAFDLTLTPEELWIFADRDPREPGDPFLGLTRRDFARLWSLHRAAFFETPPALIRDDQEAIVVERLIDSVRVRCTIDRPTLTPRLYEILDDSGSPVARLALDRYRLLDGAPFPMRSVASGDGGSIETDLDSVEIDREIPDAVFTPPARAVRQP